VAHAAHALVVIFFLDDPWKLLFDVGVNEVHKHLHLDLLVHDREAAIVLIAGLDQSRKEYVFHLLVMEVGDGQAAQLLDDGALPLA